tara:strand:+ start:1245 stop:10184 length:8940 start_codon:yes stop_codon:yes gene_type:complete
MDKKFTQNKFSEQQKSLANLFTGVVIGSSSTTASFSDDAESSNFVKSYKEQENRFVPQINFATASNFAKFGSATSYYEDAYTRIHNQYPYDGSHREKVLWNLSSSYLDKYVFDNLYPRTNGFININSGSNSYTSTKASEYYSSSAPQYVSFKGGPHADPNGNFKLDISTGLSTTSISKANIYDTGSKRNNNLEINTDNGITIEFWLKKNGWPTTPDAGSHKEVILNVTTTGSVNNDSYCILYLSSSAKDNLYFNITSGSVSSTTSAAFLFDTELTDIADGKWHHYAITAKTSGSVTAANLYLDGVFKTKQVSGSVLNPVTASTQGALGAWAGHLKAAGNTFFGPGYGNLVSASVDEFRYWKTERNAKQIGRYYISDVNGGTNTDLANVDLGVYFKFNEGITQTSSVDQTVLDYSGRLSNGRIVNYNSTNGRSINSAIVQSGKSSLEFKDPIVYSFHPTVKSSLADLKIKGNEHDFNNSNSLINSIPAWIIENDQTEGTGQLANLIQICANYLDSLYLQVEALPTIRNINYASSSAKPHFFNDRLLKDYGFNVDEILTDVSLFSSANTRDENRVFERKLYEVKNQIYKNIYNNLVHIYKTKGTKKSFRNLMRCIGIDEELIRLNLYGMNTDWQAQTNTRDVSSKTKYADFFNNNQAVVYGYPEPGNSNSRSFISGSGDATSGIDKLSSITIEADVLFPKYPLNSSANNKNFPFLSSSIFGMNGVKHPEDADNLSWPATNINASSSLQVYAVRKQKQTSVDNPEVFFMLSGSMLTAPITSSTYSDVYQNSKWKLAVRLKHRSQGAGLDFVSGSISDEVIDVSLFGAQIIADSVLNQFNISGTVQDSLKDGPFIEAKRIFAGAYRNDFTGSILQRADTFITNVRYWNSFIEDETLFYHAKNDQSYGTQHPYRNTYLFEGKKTTGLSTTEMPKIESLALNWNFNQVTSSDSSGRFVVSDFSSGSNESSDYKLSNITQRQHTGRGDFFTFSSSEVVEKKFEPSTRLVPFDQINSDDMVEVVDFEGEIFTRESRPQEYFFAFEKSMYANISDEMLNMFATIRDFHNIVGEPVNRYRKEYKEMEKLRQLFFRRVGNTPDLDKFIEYYKWIDNSISTMLMNLVPATANFANSVRTLIESHALERNKIETKFPTLELNQPEPIGQIKAINELDYDWKHGHSPISGKQNDNCLYWKDRAERNGTATTSGNSAVDAQRETIRRVANTVVSGSTYVLRKLTRPYKFTAKRSEDFTIDNIKLNFAKTELNRSNPTENIVLQRIKNFKDCNDDKELRSKRKIDFQANVNGALLNGATVAPFTIYSSSVSTGYKGALSVFSNQVEINNNHIDAYGTETQAPLQGPFSNIHVGGKKSRKAEPFSTTDRVEEYVLSASATKITLKQVPSDKPQSSYFLDEIAKRPVVIKNIKSTTSSVYLGNYSKDYQIVQTVGADTQRGWLKDNFGSVTQVTPEILNLSGNINFSNFDRSNNSLKSVTIADRFSGPGSPEAMSPGYLDPASHTFSVYNGINYRNITVRLPRSNVTFTSSNSAPATQNYQFKPFGGNPDQNLRTLRTGVPLRSLLRHPMSTEGADMYLSAPNGSFITASIHKVNRNKKNSPIPFGVFVINHALRDNGFVQHAIPQSDRQYTWITASLKNSMAGPNINTSLFYGGGGDGTTAPLGYSVKSNDTTFISASSVGITNATLFVDFANLNILVNDPLDLSSNLISSSTGEYRQTNITTIPQVEVLNSLINHRQGPYGWPSWKQTRGGLNPIVRSHRKTNTFSTIDRSAPVFDVLPYSWPDNIMENATKSFVDGRRQIINLTESVVTINYKPMHIDVFMKGIGNNGLPADTNKALSQKFKFTYGNETAYFAEDRIFNSLTADNYKDILDASRSRSEAYKAIVGLYSPDSADATSVVNPVQQFGSLKASQIVWPRTRNTFLYRTNARNSYTEQAGYGSNGYDRISHRSFWRNSIEDRKRTDLTALNSQGLVLSQSSFIGVRPSSNTYSGSTNAGALPGLSVWPLDGRYTGTGADLIIDGEGRAMPFGSIQIGAEQFILDAGVGNKSAGSGYPARNASISGELFSSGMYRSMTYNVGGGPNTVDVANRFVTASARYHGVDWNMSAYSGSGRRLGTINTRPQVLQYTASSNIEWTTNIDSGKNPWYDSYDDYAADLRKIGKDYSVVPEFNISDHMHYYVNEKKSDFLSEMPTDKLIIQGIHNSSSVNSRFYEDYSHSDFLKNFDLVINDHKEIADVKTINLTCHGLKKLLPYNGFYPVTRTLQMATLLSESIGSRIVGSGSGNDAVYAPSVYPPLPDVQGLQALLQPLMAPGILYNTIKSGIAVDWPLYTGSAPTAGITGQVFTTLVDVKNYISSSANYRLPFEAIYNLDNIPISKEGDVKEIYALTNETTDAHFSWTGNRNNDLYERAMNNFLAESVNLFLDSGKLTSFKSKPMSEVSFKNGVNYRMSIDIQKTAGFLMTEGASSDSIASSDLWKSANFVTQSFAWHGTAKRGIIYGPAVRFFDVKSTGRLSSSGWPYCEQNDPAFAPYTPPYFYGKATVDLVYTNTVDHTETPSLSTIFAYTSASYSNDLNNIPTGSYYTSSVAVRTNGLPWRTIVSSSSPAIQTMMQVSSSINLFGRTNSLLQTVAPDGTPISFTDPEDPTDQERWVISTKYECPVLNFNHYTKDTKARGMWNGYGNIPDYSTEGIEIKLRETNPTALFNPSINSTEGSLLMKFFGAEQKRKSVGKLAKDFTKSISECIVAIPYLPGNNASNSLAAAYDCIYSRDDDKYFFPIKFGSEGTKFVGSVPAGGAQLKEEDKASESTEGLIEKMKKFVFPPRYDWVNNEEPVLSPFAMFAFEFKHYFSRQELADMWQGVMPDIATKVVPETTSLSIPVAPGELMGEFFAKISQEDNSNSDITNTMKNLKWMVFKVKQRAKNVYANITEDITDNKSGTFFGVGELFNENELPYSYNWPYDYCSLVELAKFEAGIEIK